MTLGDLPLQSMCSPKSKHLSPVKGRLNIPARSPGTPELEIRKTRSGPAGEEHRVQQAVAKQIWVRFEGKTRTNDIWRQDSDIEEEIREKMRIEKRWDIYMTNEGKVVGWRDLEARRDGRMVEIGLRMRGKQGIGGRIKFTGVVEERGEEHGARKATIGEKGSCFQLSSEADGSIGEGKLQETEICVLEGNSDGEDKEASSSDGDMKRIGDGITVAGGFGHT